MTFMRLCSAQDYGDLWRLTLTPSRETKLPLCNTPAHQSRADGVRMPEIGNDSRLNSSSTASYSTKVILKSYSLTVTCRYNLLA
jgi:hypothetical protein